MNKKISSQEAKNRLFYQFPKFLMLDSSYKHMSNDSKILYMLYYERTRLSLKNGWIDENNYIYIRYKNSKAMEILNCRSEKLNKLKKELHKYNLIDEVQQGCNRANLIYVLESDEFKLDVDEFETIEISGNSKIEQRKFENRTKEIRKSNTSNNNISNTTTPEQTFVVDSEIKDLKNLIEKTVDRKITWKGINYLLLESNKETILYYINKWDKFDYSAKKNPMGYFIGAVIEKYPVPKEQEKLAYGKPIQSTNYEQRKYDDDFFDSLYDNVQFIKE